MEGGFRVPMIVRWPGVIQPGTDHNEIFSQEDWMPTLMAAVGEPNVVEKLKQGYKASGSSAARNSEFLDDIADLTRTIIRLQ
jgi:arylsulfatase A-like enzyme